MSNLSLSKLAEVIRPNAHRSATRNTTWQCTRCLHRASPLVILLPVVMPGCRLSSSLQTASNIYLLVPFILCQQCSYPFTLQSGPTSSFPCLFVLGPFSIAQNVYFYSFAPQQISRDHAIPRTTSRRLHKRCHSDSVLTSIKGRSKHVTTQ